jgi:hypothetical protein
VLVGEDEVEDQELVVIPQRLVLGADVEGFAGLVELCNRLWLGTSPESDIQ